MILSLSAQAVSRPKSLHFATDKKSALKLFSETYSIEISTFYALF